jgi:hypothetical protein
MTECALECDMARMLKNGIFKRRPFKIHMIVYLVFIKHGPSDIGFALQRKCKKQNNIQAFSVFHGNRLP